MEITISLPDKIFANVANFASKTHRRIDEIIVEKIERDFSPEIERPLLNCTNAEVLALANMKMSEAENNRLSELFDNQREEVISPLERNELDALMRVYEVGNLRKAQGIVEAVQRGLIKTPDDLA
jgi:hypothetical protein